MLHHRQRVWLIKSSAHHEGISGYDYDFPTRQSSFIWLRSLLLFRDRIPICFWCVFDLCVWKAALLIRFHLHPIHLHPSLQHTMAWPWLWKLAVWLFLPSWVCRNRAPCVSIWSSLLLAQSMYSAKERLMSHHHINICEQTNVMKVSRGLSCSKPGRVFSKPLTVGYARPKKLDWFFHKPTHITVLLVVRLIVHSSVLTPFLKCWVKS